MKTQEETLQDELAAAKEANDLARIVAADEKMKAYNKEAKRQKEERSQNPKLKIIERLQKELEEEENMTERMRIAKEISLLQ